MTPERAIPYVVGQWVRGQRFYGRRAQISEILNGPRNWLWLLGNRRIGKTSLLKQIEHLAGASPDRRYLPLFWDLQGAEDPGELHLDFQDAVLDAEERLAEVGIAVSEVQEDDLFASLGRLRRRLRAEGLSLLLLCDEVEELIGLHKKDPALLRKLRRALQSREGIRSVLASSIRLWVLADQKEDTSPFLLGFAPPLYIGVLDDDEARSLIRQSHLPAGSQPVLRDDVVEAILRRCDNHPFLIQLLCKRYLELGDLEEACEQVATDRMVSYFFAVDFDTLTEIERDVIRFVAEQPAASSRSLERRFPLESGALRGSLHRLENLGFLRRSEEGRLVIGNFFLRRWLRDHSEVSGFPLRHHSVRPASASSTAEATPAKEAVPGKLDGRYELLQEVGAGATGVVFKAYDTLLETPVAIKVLRPHHCVDEQALERFRQEIVLARDIGHPNILRVYHLGDTEGRKYLTMQWVGGPTLARLIADQAPMPPGTVIDIAVQLASALAAAHARMILHRDIKPGNILLDQGGVPYLADFGLARLVGAPGITSAGIFVGTPYYASPEQVCLGPLDGRSDLYSLGLVLFEMATGRKAFEADSSREVLRMQSSARPPDPRQHQPTLPRGLAEVILRCLEKDPAHRYPSADALARELGDLASL